MPYVISDCYLDLPNAPTSVDLTADSVDTSLPGLIGVYRPHGWGFLNNSYALAIMSNYICNKYLIDDCYVVRGQSKAWRLYQSADNMLQDRINISSPEDLVKLWYANFYTLNTMIEPGDENSPAMLFLAKSLSPEFPWTIERIDNVLKVLTDLRTKVVNKEIQYTSTYYSGSYKYQYYDTTLEVEGLSFNVHCVRNIAQSMDWSTGDLNSYISKYTSYRNILSGDIVTEKMQGYIDGDIDGISDVDRAIDSSGELAYTLDDGDDLYLRHGYFTVIEPNTYLINLVTGEYLTELPCQTWAMSVMRDDSYSKNANLKPIYKTSVKPAEHGAVTLRGLNDTTTSDGEIFTKQDTYIVDGVETDSDDVLLAYALEQVGEAAPLKIESIARPVTMLRSARRTAPASATSSYTISGY